MQKKKILFFIILSTAIISLFMNQKEEGMVVKTEVQKKEKAQLWTKVPTKSTIEKPIIDSVTEKKGAVKKPSITPKKISKKEVDLPRSKDVFIDHLMDVSGMLKQLENFDDILDQSTAGIDINDEKQKKFLDSFKRNFKGENLIKEIKKEIENSFTMDELRNLDSYFNDPEIKDISALEEAASTPEAVNKFKEYTNDFDKNPPSKSRHALVEELDKSLKGTDNTLLFYEEIMKGLSIGRNQNLPKEERKSSEDIDKDIKAMRAQISKDVRDSVMKGHHFTYQDLSDEQLKNYLSKTKGPLHTKMQAAISKALKRSLRRGGKKMGEELD